MWSLPPTVSRLMTIYPHPQLSSHILHSSTLCLNIGGILLLPISNHGHSFFRILSFIREADNRIPRSISCCSIPSWSGLFENSRRTSFSNPGRPVSSAALSFKVALYLKITFCPYTFSFKIVLLIKFSIYDCFDVLNLYFERLTISRIRIT